MDLSTNLGVQAQFDHPDYKEALRKVVAAAKKHGKAAGILLKDPADIEKTVEDGFTFVALGSDTGAAAKGLRDNAAAFAPFRG